MNYYIQGDAAKADKIKAAFERLGYNTGNLGFNSGQLYYTVEGKVELMCTKSLQNLIKTHPDYKELKLLVEPKFKVGDWLVYENGDCFAGGLREVQVQTVEKDRYIFTQNTNGSFRFIDSNCRLWSIADAKDGDVLVKSWHEDGDSWEKIIIFKNYHAKGVKGLFKNPCVEGYGNTFKNGKLAFREEVPYYSKTWTDNLQPATAKQRELLFRKMKENGYEWDTDKKELRKIQPHYDIANFHAGMPVLVRDYDNSRWSYVQFSHYVGECGMKFNACGIPYIQCIPFEGNEHLLGTTDPCDEQYINW